MYRPALAVVLLAACGATTPEPDHPGSRGLHADEHMDEARRHEEISRQQRAYPDIRSDGTGRVDQAPVAYPWVRTWDTSSEHDRMAQVHRSQAAQLQAEYESACGQRAASDVSISPIERYGISGQSVDDGIIVYLSTDAGSPDKLLADMRCHRAWMMLVSTNNMDDCPLDLNGINVQAKGDKDAIELHITVKDRALIPELQRRAAHELEVKKTKTTR